MIHRRPHRSFPILLLLSLGSVGCGGSSPAAQQCVASGGDWRLVRECPSACSPPAPTLENCRYMGAQVCASVCGKEPVCACPAEAPFWVDGEGCVGTEFCPEGGTGTPGA